MLYALKIFYTHWRNKKLSFNHLVECVGKPKHFHATPSPLQLNLRWSNYIHVKNMAATSEGPDRETPSHGRVSICVAGALLIFLTLSRQVGMERSSRPAESHQDPAWSQRPAAGISDPLTLQIWSCLGHIRLLTETLFCRHCTSRTAQFSASTVAPVIIL